RPRPAPPAGLGGGDLLRGGRRGQRPGRAVPRRLARRGARLPDRRGRPSAELRRHGPRRALARDDPARAPSERRGPAMNASPPERPTYLACLTPAGAGGPASLAPRGPRGRAGGRGAPPPPGG